MKWRIEVYNGSLHPALHPYLVQHAITERAARRIAARALRHTTLRGASTWDRPQGGTVYQFGPRHEGSDADFAVIEAVD